MRTEHYDVVVIGSGSGNSLPGEEFADLRVAVVEAGVFGGTCLNNGCIPTKMFVWTAETANRVREVEQFGLSAELTDVRWTEIRDRVFHRIDPISEGGARYRREAEGTDLYEGWARFTGERQLDVALHEGGTVRLTADQVVIATGSAPTVPDALAPLMGTVGHTNRTIMRLEKLPARMTIVGGGVVAVEFAHVFSGLGVEVTLVVRGERLLRDLDEELSLAFTALARKRWDVRTGTEVTGAEVVGAGTGAHLTLDDGETLETEVVLVATGRRPATDGLDADAAGVRVDEQGFVECDEHGRTSAEGVWTLGDVCDPTMLKHVANAQARVVFHNLVHPEELQSFPTVPVVAGVFSTPEIGTVGLTEAQAREAGHEVVTHTQEYAAVAYGWAMEDHTGRCRVIADADTGQVLGGWVMGHQAAILVNLLGEAVISQEPAHEWARGRYWPHPALSEVVENALLGLPAPRGTAAGR